MTSTKTNGKNGAHKKPQDLHTVVVGGGLAGLAAACELSTHGVRVTLVEKNTHLGGKMNVLEEGGFTFDMGPTIITMPQVLCGIMRRAGKDPTDYIDLVDLDPQWRCHYEDGTVIDLRLDPEDTARGLDAQFPGQHAGKGFKEFLQFSRRMFRLSEQVFFYKDLGGMTDLMKSPPKDPALLKDVLGMRLHSTVGDTIAKHVAEPHVRQMCEHFLQYVGSSPFLAPAVLSLIASAQADHGCWYPMGGTRNVARSLARLAEEQGVEFVNGHGVESIVVDDDGTARAVELDDGRVIEADAVVSNCDVQRTYRDLIGTREARGAWRNIESRYKPACSGVVLYLGLDKRYDHLAHHNFLFSRDPHAEFEDIYTRGEPARDPTLYLAVPSRTDEAQAPAGGEALYILVHTAYLRDRHEWQTPDGQAGPLFESYKQVVMDKLRRFGMEDVDAHIKVDRWLTPKGIERMYNAEGGAIYGLASHGKLAGGFKPANRSREFGGLYFVGGSANPGPGVPMVTMSGVIGARCVLEDEGIETNDTHLDFNTRAPGRVGAAAPAMSAPAGV
ncbi:MAG: phytoene desaturase family protein [Planctomycetota bacterium]